MRTQYEFILPNNYVCARFTLYGDHDPDVNRVLLAMLRESVALSKVTCGKLEVRVCVDQVEL